MTRQLPVVSIVTPSFNHAPYIRATIESVLSQRYPNLEYIVVDGGSTDESPSIAQSYGSRLKFISEPDNGQAHAINKGFAMANGSILAWLNSDDILLPGAVNAAMAAMDRAPAAGLVYGEGYRIDHNGKIRDRYPHTRPPNLWRFVHLSDFIMQQTVFFRRKALEAVGYLDEKLHYGMDWDVLIRVGLKYQLAYTSDYLACIRIHPKTKTATGGMRRIRELHAILRKHTGMRLPPGSLTYGLGSLAQFCGDCLDRRLPRALAPVLGPLQWAINTAASRAAGPILLHYQGLYDDGWAGKKLRYMLPAGGDEFLIEGFVPPWAERLVPQTLSVHCGNLALGAFRLSAGEFQIRLTVPPILREAALNLKIAATRSFLPSQFGWEGDHRRLAYLLRDIRWAQDQCNDEDE